MSTRSRWKNRRTRHELLKLKKQLELAKKAHTSLEEKYKVLFQEAQHIKKTLLPFQKKLKEKMEKAYSLLSEALTSLGVRKVYKAGISSKANDEVELKWTTIRGIPAPQIISKIQKRTPLERGYDLSETNYLLDTAAEAFEDALSSLIEVAELKNIHQKLEREVEKTRIRFSALEKILIPNLEEEINLIENKLEEKEREHHIMVKWVKENLLEES